MGVLLLTRPGQPANTYGRFTDELLKADGFADLEIASLDDAATLQRLGDPAGADAPDAVVVTRLLATKAQAAALVDFVTRGGRLIALRPSRLLATGLGLMPL